MKDDFNVLNILSFSDFFAKKRVLT